MPVPLSVPTRTAKYDGSGGIACEDADEMGTMFVSQSRVIKTGVERVALKLGHFDTMTPYDVKFVHISLRGGSGTIYVYTSSDDEQPEETFELHNIINVKKISLEEREALQFKKFDEHEHEYTENVYGHIGVRLELLDPSAAHAFFTSSGAKAKSIEKLALKGRATILQLAFGCVADRDAWHAWFSELVVLRELSEIDRGGFPVPAEAELATDSDSDDARPSGERNRPQRSAPFSAATAADADSGTFEGMARISEFPSTPMAKRLLKDYVKSFLTRPMKANRDTDREPPSRGKVLVRPPGSGTFSPQVVSARFMQSEITFTARKHGGRIFSKTIDVGRKLVLHDRTLIVASQPWSNDFELYEVDSIWGFRCKTVEDRNAFVRWLRFVKGKGAMLAQTEQETFPYLRAVGETAGGGGAHAAVEAPLRRGAPLQFAGERGAFDDVDAVTVESEDDVDPQHRHLGRAKRHLFDEDVEGEEGGSGARSASGMRRGSVDGDSTGRGHSRSQRRRSSEWSDISKSHSARATPSPTPRSPSGRRGEDLDADVDVPKTPSGSDSGSGSGSSSGVESVRSVRAFYFFPTHLDCAVEPYVDECAGPHLIGRNRRSGDGGGQRWAGRGSGPQALSSAGAIARAVEKAKARLAQQERGAAAAARSGREGRSAAATTPHGGRRAVTTLHGTFASPPRPPQTRQRTQTPPTRQRAHAAGGETPPPAAAAAAPQQQQSFHRKFSLRNVGTAHGGAAPSTPRASFSCHGQVLAAASVRVPAITMHGRLRRADDTHAPIAGFAADEGFYATSVAAPLPLPAAKASF